MRKANNEFRDSDGVKERAGGRIAASPATAVYTASRCQNFFACWVVDNQLSLAPAGWTFEYTGAGAYRIYPTPADVPDLAKAIAIASAYVMPAGAPGLPPSSSRTFVVSFDSASACFDVWAVDAQQATVDSPFSLFVVVPG